MQNNFEGIHFAWKFSPGFQGKKDFGGGEERGGGNGGGERERRERDRNTHFLQLFIKIKITTGSFSGSG